MVTNHDVTQTSTTQTTWSQGSSYKSTLEEKKGEMSGGHDITLGPIGKLSVENNIGVQGPSTLKTQDTTPKDPNNLHSHDMKQEDKAKLEPETPIVRTDHVGTVTLHTDKAAEIIMRVRSQIMTHHFPYTEEGSSLRPSTPQSFIEREFEVLLEHKNSKGESPSKEEAVSILKEAIRQEITEGKTEDVQVPKWAEAMLSKLDSLGGSEKTPETKSDAPLTKRVDDLAQETLQNKSSSSGIAKFFKAIAKPFQAMARGIAQVATRISESVKGHFENIPEKNRKLIDGQGFKWEIDDVYNNPKLFKAMEKFAQSRFQGESFTFISGVKDLQKETDPVKFQQGLEKLYDKCILGKEDDKDKGISHSVNIYPEQQKPLEALKNGPITSDNLAEVKSKLDSLMKEVVGAESMWSREIVGSFKTANPPKAVQEAQAKVKTVKTETPTTVKISKTTQAQIDIIKQNPNDKVKIQEAINTIINSVSDKLTGEEKTKAIAKELTSVLAQIKPPVTDPKPNVLANTMVSFALGQAILKPRNDPNGISNIDKGNVMNSITLKGIEQPGKCGADLWRTMSRMKFTQEGVDEPLFDGTKGTDGESKDKSYSLGMMKAINLFYQKATGKTDDLVTEEDMGDGQSGATDLGEALEYNFVLKTLSDKPDSEDKRKIDKTIGNIFDLQMKLKLAGGNKDEQQKLETQMNEQEKIYKEMLPKLLSGEELGNLKKFQRLFGLGAQELFTRPADWAIPTNFRKGEGQLSVAEYSGAYVKQMEPLQYGREIEVRIEKDGKIKYVVTQPITFKDAQVSEPIGLSRVQTAFTFDANMDCEKMEQEVMQAKLQS